MSSVPVVCPYFQSLPQPLGYCHYSHLAKLRLAEKATLRRTQTAKAMEPDKACRRWTFALLGIKQKRRIKKNKKEKPCFRRCSVGEAACPRPEWGKQPQMLIERAFWGDWRNRPPEATGWKGRSQEQSQNNGELRTEKEGTNIYMGNAMRPLRTDSISEFAKIYLSWPKP